MRRAALGVVAIVAMAACSSAPADDGTANADAITDAAETSARNQKDTGNCWLYATAAWAESLELSAKIERGEASKDDKASYPAHLSVAYWDYWDWYTKITGGTIKGVHKVQDVKDLLDSGGSWGAAAEIIAKYGVARTQAFLGKGANKDADVATDALGTITTSLLSGPLKLVASRQNRKLVRSELNRAFGITDDVAAQLDDAFGDGSKTFADSAVDNDLILSPSEYQVRLPHPDGTADILPIGEAIGTRAPGDDPDKRVGAHAWNVVPFTPGTPDQNRAYFLRIQKALAAGVPLPISWYVASNGDPDDSGSYESTPATPASADDSGGHETLLTDYDIDGVPGFGHLEAGTPATDEQKQAALDPAATMKFLRVKNSWGTRVKSAAPAGYNDLYVDYLVNPLSVCPKGAKAGSPKCTQEIPLEDVTLPAGF